MTLHDLYKEVIVLSDPDAAIRRQAERLAQDCRRVNDEALVAGAFPSDFQVVLTFGGANGRNLRARLA